MSERNEVWDEPSQIDDEAFDRWIEKEAALKAGGGVSAHSTEVTEAICKPTLAPRTTEA